MKTEVFYCKSDMHVRSMRFSILCTPTDSSDKNTNDVFYYVAVLVYTRIRYEWKQAELQFRLQQQI